MNSTATLLLVLLVLAVVSFFFSRRLARGALKVVLQTFLRLEAVDPEHAVTQEQLGVVPRGLFSLRMGLRDYRPAALRLLQQADIVRQTADGRLYLSVTALKASNLKSYAPDL
jgi:hypothetical protein